MTFNEGLKCFTNEDNPKMCSAALRSSTHVCSRVLCRKYWRGKWKITVKL